MASESAVRSKIIAVTGATGAQGGGLVRAILADKSGAFVARAITRKPTSDAANALRALGVEVVEGNLDDVESLKVAFSGAYGVFGVTAFWETFSPEREGVQAKNIADAAAACHVAHTIWSTLDDTRLLCPLADARMPTLHGKYKVPHFDGKGEANKFFSVTPTTLLNTVFYWDNLIGFMPPARGADGKLSMTMPMGDARLPGIAVADIGKCSLGIFRRPDLIGKTVGIAGEAPTVGEMAGTLSGAIGEEVRYNAVDPRVFASFGFPGADDMANMFQFKRDFNEYYVGSRDVALSRALNPELQTFAQWAAANHGKIPTK